MMRGDDMCRRVRSEIVVAMIMVLGMLAGASLAQQDIAVQAGVSERSVYVGQPVTFQIRVNGSQSPAEPVWPTLDGVDVQPQGGQNTTQSSITIINGRREERRFEGYIFNYQVVFQKPGLQTIPALTVDVDGKEYRTNPVVVNVREPQNRSDVRLRIEVDNASPYVGEAVELRATLYLRSTVQNVSLSLPRLDGSFETYDVPGADIQSGRQAPVEFLGSRVQGERGQAMLDGQQYDTFTVRKLLVPLVEGPQQLGPATLSCQVVIRQSRSFFDDDQIERASVPSNAIQLDVRALPEDGKPANFSGLIGRYSVSAAASATDVYVGDPITLTIRVGSGGAVLRDPRIDLTNMPGFRNQFRVTETQTEPERRNGQLIYEQTIRPLSDSVKEIPPIEIPYFDTASGEYAVASTNAIPLSVRPTRIVTAGDAVGAAPGGPLGTDVESAKGGIEHNFSAAESLVDQRFVLAEALESPIWFAALAGPPVLYFGAAFMLMWRKRGRADEAGRRQRRALAVAKRSLGETQANESQADRVGRAVRQYMADRFDRPAAGMTTADCVQLLEPIDASLAERLDQILRECDAARYGGAGAAPGDDLQAKAQALLAEIDRAATRGEAVAA